MRLRYVPEAFNIIDNSKSIIKNPEELKGKYKEIFNNPKEIHLEIGCGKGDFLKQNALLNKSNLYIGIEMMSSVICRACQKIDTDEIDNIKLINKDGSNILDYFDNNEIDYLYLNFPDPWPKARHAKRRLTSPKFLEMYKIILKDNGIFRFKTDNVDLFEYSKETILPLLKDGYYFGIVDEKKEIIKTEFETKYTEAGKEIYMIKGQFK